MNARRATRVALAALALASCLAACSVAAARPDAASTRSDLARNGTTAGTGIMALGCSLRNFSAAHLQTFRYVVFSDCDSSRARRLPGTTLHYFSPAIPNDRFSGGTVTVARARANGWLLADAAGNYVHPYRDEHRWLTDVGSAAFQRATAKEILATLSAHPGIDGVELDNVLPDVAYFNINRTWPAKYPNARAWQDAQASFVRVVGRALRSRGYYVLVNGTGYIDQGDFDSGAFSRAWYARLARTKGVNAIFAEEWLQSPIDHSSLMDNSDPGDFMTSWAGWQQLVKACQKNGVDFFGGLVGPPGDKRKMRYGRGSFLLDWDGAGGMFFYAVEPAYGGSDSWDAVWTRGIGSPKGAKVRLATNVWHRAYSRGWVVVNANRSESWTGTVNGTRVTVPAKDAVVRFNRRLAR